MTDAKSRAILELMMQGFQNVEKQLSTIESRMARMGKSANTASSSLSNVEKSAASTSRRVTTLSKSVDGTIGSFANLVKTGFVMSVAWQAMNGVITTVTSAINELIMGNVELEASMLALESTARSTGRSYASVMEIMSSETDAFMTKASLAPGVLRLLSTELDTEQIKKFVQAVKDGSAAMGYQADEQLPLLARGYKQLTANILDNIGVTTNLNRLRRKASDELGVAADLLSEAQIHQALYNEIIEQTAKFTGLYAQQADTAKGSIAGLNAEWKKLVETVSDVQLVKGAYDFATTLVSDAKNLVESARAIELYGNELEKATARQGLFGLTMVAMQKNWPQIGRNMEKREALLKTLKTATTGMNNETEKGIAYMSNWAKIMQYTEGETTAYDKQIQWLIEDFADMQQETIANSKLAEDYVTAQKNIEDQMLDTQKAMTTYMDENEKIQKQTKQWSRELHDLRNQLSLVNDVMSSQADIVRDLESKMKVLDPQKFMPTEDLLQDVRRDLEKAEEKVESTRAKMFERVEPRQYQEYVRQHDLAKREKIKLADEESKLTEKLKKEIEELQRQIVTTIELDGKTYELEEAKGILEGRITSLTQKMWEENEAMKDNKEAIEEMKEPLDILSEKLEKVKGQLEFININWEGIQTLSKEGLESLIDMPPGRASGGYIPKTGLYKLHEGESVMSSREVNASNTYNYNFSQGAFTVSPNMDARMIFEQIQRQAVASRARSMS